MSVSLLSRLSSEPWFVAQTLPGIHSTLKALTYRVSPARRTDDHCHSLSRDRAARGAPGCRRHASRQSPFISAAWKRRARRDAHRTVDRAWSDVHADRAGAHVAG